MVRGWRNAVGRHPLARRTRRLRLAVGVTGLLAVAVAALPPVHSAFVGTTTNGGNSLTAAASFPDYPTTVIEDHPQTYYRLDDPAGAVTAADSSGNGTTGAFGTAYNRTWAGLWPMDDNTGTTAKDMSGVATTHDLTLSGATWTASGRSRSGLSFNGTSHYAAAAASVLTTNASFTVTAWVNLTDATVSRTAVSQDGTNVSGFELGYDQPLNRWVFAMPRSNSAVATVDKISSTAAPVAGWNQLTASYDSSNNRMHLWVNGAYQSFTTFAGTAWNATGVFQVGAGKITSRTHFWQGTIDAVRGQAGVASDQAAQELTIGPTGGASTSWQLNENTGTTTIDSSGNGNTGTFGSSASWGVAKTGASSVDLPGDANGYVAGAAQGVDTRTSFSVSAWVYLDHTTLGAMGRTAVSQSGAIKTGFMLRYNQYSTRWEFDVTQGAADNYSPTYDIAYSANSSAALTTWTHLVGVHDASAQTIALYVNGVAQTGASHTSVFNATGPLQVGRVKEFGAWGTGGAGNEVWGPWAGRVDDARVFRRALGVQDVTAIYNGGHVFGSLGMSGALQGAQQGQTSSTAQAFGNGFATGYDPTSYTNPTTFSLECWFRSNGQPASATQGQALIGFSSLASGNSPSFGRRLFVDVTGHVGFGTNSGLTGNALTSGTYRDNAWHHLVATLSPANGMKLYVDGVLSASASYAAPGNYAGYWRWGGDTWSAAWLSDYNQYDLLDEVAVYTTELTAQQVARHYYANH
jgi:hypothetical protein